MARILMPVRPSKGGAFWHAVRLCAALDELGHETAVCGPHAAHRDLPVATIDLDIPRSISPVGDARAVAGFTQIVKRFQPDLIHTHGSQASAVCRVARPLAPRIPIVFSPHNFAFTSYFATRGERFAYRAVETALAPLTTRFIAVCEAELREVAMVGGKRRGRLVHNGINPVPAAEPDPRLAELRSRGPILALVTNFLATKGIPTLLEALPEILREHPRATLAIAGDGELRDEIATAIERSGLSENVAMLGQVEDIPAVLAAADIFVAPAWAEAFPYAILEAMSARLPIVATDVGGVGEAIIDNRTGRLVPAQDPGALGDAVVALLDDRAQARRLADAAKSMVDERFTLERMIAGTRAVYAEIGIT